MPALQHFGDFIVPLGATPDGVEKAIFEAARLREIVRRHGGNMDDSQSVKALLHVRGFDDWDQLCVSLSAVADSDVERVFEDDDEFDDLAQPPRTDLITGMSVVEIAMRIKDHALDLGHYTAVARQTGELVERVLKDLPEPVKIDARDMLRQAREIALGWGWNEALWSLTQVLEHRDINIFQSRGQRLDIEPSAKHPPAGREWMSFKALGTSEEVDMGPMAFIGRKDDDDAPMLRLLQDRGSQCARVDAEATLTDELRQVIAAYTGYRNDVPFRSAVDYLGTALFHWDKTDTFDHERPIRPVQRVVISIPWHPHDEMIARQLEAAYRAGIDLVLRVATAKHRRAQNAYARELIGNCRHIALGPRTVLPPFVPMDLVANHTEETIFKPLPAE